MVVRSMGTLRVAEAVKQLLMRTPVAPLSSWYR